MAVTKYKDVRFFIWLIPFVNCINYYLTYSGFGFNWHTLATFSIDTAEGYLMWLGIRAIILWLDKKLPYGANPVKRIVVQQILTLLGGMATLVILTEFVNVLATPKPVPASFYTKDLFIISIWVFVVTGVYIGLHYYQQWKLVLESIKEERKIKTDGFKVSTGKKDMLFKFNEIAGFYVDGDYAVVVTLEPKKYLIDSSLDKLEKSLPVAFFYRLNRQYIVHRQLVMGFEKADDGKINVLVKNITHLPSSIPVSRTKAPGFKLWFAPK